jgi:BMFP domain-containing protein YqiC
VEGGSDLVESDGRDRTNIGSSNIKRIKKKIKREAKNGKSNIEIDVENKLRNIIENIQRNLNLIGKNTKINLKLKHTLF